MEKICDRSSETPVIYIHLHVPNHFEQPDWVIMLELDSATDPPLVEWAHVNYREPLSLGDSSRVPTAEDFSRTKIGTAEGSRTGNYCLHGNRIAKSATINKVVTEKKCLKVRQALRTWKLWKTWKRENLKTENLKTLKHLKWSLGHAEQLLFSCLCS